MPNLIQIGLGAALIAAVGAPVVNELVRDPFQPRSKTELPEPSRVPLPSMLLTSTSSASATSSAEMRTVTLDGEVVALPPLERPRPAYWGDPTATTGFVLELELPEGKPVLRKIGSGKIASEA